MFCIVLHCFALFTHPPTSPTYASTSSCPCVLNFAPTVPSTVPFPFPVPSTALPPPTLPSLPLASLHTTAHTRTHTRTTRTHTQNPPRGPSAQDRNVHLFPRRRPPPPRYTGGSQRGTDRGTHTRGTPPRLHHRQHRANPGIAAVGC